MKNVAWTFILEPPHGVETWATEVTYVTQRFQMRCMTLESIKELHEQFKFLTECTRQAIVQELEQE